MVNHLYWTNAHSTNFRPGVIHTIKIAHRRTLLDRLLAALGAHITEGKSFNLHAKYAEKKENGKTKNKMHGQHRRAGNKIMWWT